MQLCNKLIKSEDVIIILYFFCKFATNDEFVGFVSK